MTEGAKPNRYLLRTTSGGVIGNGAGYPTEQETQDAIVVQLKANPTSAVVVYEAKEVIVTTAPVLDRKPLRY